MPAQFVKMEAETLTLDYIEIYGGEKFKSFIAQDISVLHQHYPRLLLDAQTTVDNENKRKEQKKRKLEESAGGSAAGGSAAGGSAAGGSAAGGSAGVDAMETALLQARPGPCPRMMSLMYQKQIERLVKQIQDQSQVYEQAIRFANIRKQDMNTERWLALDKCERTESKNAELHKEISELKVEIAKLKGKRLDLPPRELDELLDVVKETIRKISDQKNLQEVKEKMEGENIFCCSLSGGLFEFPVLALDGYTYEKEKIEQWIEVQLDKNEVYVDRRGKWLSPKTGVLLPSTLLVPNFDIKSLMEEEIHKRLVEMRDLISKLGTKSVEGSKTPVLGDSHFPRRSTYTSFLSNCTSIHCSIFSFSYVYPSSASTGNSKSPPESEQQKMFSPSIFSFTS